MDIINAKCCISSAQKREYISLFASISSSRKHCIIRDIRLWRRFARLPLTSELDALCAANANPARFASCGSESSIPRQRKEKRPPRWWSFFFGRGIGIRTPTYRVRVCCAAVTQFPCVITDYILAHIIWFVNSFFEILFAIFILVLKMRARCVIMMCVIYSGVRESNVLCAFAEK